MFFFAILDEENSLHSQHMFQQIKRADFLKWPSGQLRSKFFFLTRLS